MAGTALTWYHGLRSSKTPVPDTANKIISFPRRRFWKAYYAALVTVLCLTGVAAVVTPPEFVAGIWLHPLTLTFFLLISALVLAPVALLNMAILVRLFSKMRAAHWRNPVI
jgi:protein-S-isoprenylcysteine O-methyltransferase Ste14